MGLLQLLSLYKEAVATGDIVEKPEDEYVSDDGWETASDDDDDDDEGFVHVAITCQHSKCFIILELYG